MTPAQTPPVAESVEVTQADRVLFSMMMALDVTEDPKRIMAGQFDNHRKMQAVARHRLAAHEAGRAEGVRAAAEVADKVRGGWVNGDATTPYGQAYQAGALDAATAIRALSKEPTK